MQQIAGKAVWEFADRWATTIIDGDQDLRRTAGLHNAYRPYRLADQLIFVGKRFGRYLVIYDGRQIGPLFDDVTIVCCCEGPLYPLNRGTGRYLFRGKRAGRTYLVEITATEPKQGQAGKMKDALQNKRRIVISLLVVSLLAYAYPTWLLAARCIPQAALVA